MKINHKKLYLQELQANQKPSMIKFNLQFFKAQKGEYGYGDKFWGVPVPTQRKILKKYIQFLTLQDIEDFLRNPIHEVRFSALLALIEKYKVADRAEKNKLAKLFLDNVDRANNWDFVDLAAPAIAGEFWFNSSTKEMFDFAKSGDLWKERIAMVSTIYFIKKNRFEEAMKLCEFFLGNDRDLIQKASGWMLREVGKREQKLFYDFLDKHHKKMPRTMLRYAIEKLSREEREKYMER
ncbi:MAG: DNA alkylation repair protein [Elusimicrobiota bacterium]|jgi:3-methyladenine DNA glycosylase AlkD|nr:DNA alkylation repair protein [Elusimicrobiota bacterium]